MNLIQISESETILGETGRSTLVNALLNYTMGVQLFSGSFRFLDLSDQSAVEQMEKCFQYKPSLYFYLTYNIHLIG